jgi:hypothetical protein
MYTRMRPLCWAVTLLVSACAVPGITPAPEVEVSSEELYHPCVDQACGTECRQCAPNEPRCLETAVVPRGRCTYPQ